MFEKLFGLLNGNESEQEKNKKLFDYGLDSKERKALRKEKYDYWNFDEEDLEDDDYYVEDDDVKTSPSFFETSSEKTSRENFFGDDDDEE